jgi:hypothetical protein
MGLFAWLAKRRLAKARKLSQPFAIAVADSMIEKPNEWVYLADEKWLENEKADIRTSVPQRAPTEMDIIRSRTNGVGSGVLAKYYRGSWDRWLIERAYRKWMEATALERERDRETWKARAMVAMAGQ